MRKIQAIVTTIMSVKPSDKAGKFEQDLAIVVQDMRMFMEGLDYEDVPYEHWSLQVVAELLKHDNLATKTLPNKQSFYYLWMKLLERTRWGERHGQETAFDEETIRSKLAEGLQNQAEAERQGAIERYVGEEFTSDHFVDRILPDDPAGFDHSAQPYAFAPRDDHDDVAGWEPAEPEEPAADFEEPQAVSDGPLPIQGVVSDALPVVRTNRHAPGIPKLPTMADLFKDDDDE